MGIKITKELVDHLKTLRFAELDENGHELHNPTPLVHHCEFDAPMSLQERIQRILRTELSHQASLQGHETFEESNDFDVEDDSEPTSQYELMEDEFPLPEAPQSPPAADDGNPDPPAGDPLDPSPADLDPAPPE